MHSGTFADVSQSAAAAVHPSEPAERQTGAIGMHHIADTVCVCSSVNIVSVCVWFSRSELEWSSYGCNAFRDRGMRGGTEHHRSQEETTSVLFFVCVCAHPASNNLLCDWCVWSCVLRVCVCECLCVCVCVLYAVSRTYISCWAQRPQLQQQRSVRRLIFCVVRLSSVCVKSKREQ